MSAKIVLLVVAVFAVFQMCIWQSEAGMIKREVEQESTGLKLEGLEEASKQVQDAFAELQKKMNELAESFQNDPFVKNITETIQKQAASLTGSSTTA